MLTDVNKFYQQKELEFVGVVLGKQTIFVPFQLVGWLVGFYGISTFEIYLMPNQFSFK